ncbi:MAG: hypothetical protein ACPGQS_13995 [Bradymonadia bacterium]
MRMIPLKYLSLCLCLVLFMGCGEDSTTEMTRPTAGQAGDGGSAGEGGSSGQGGESGTPVQGGSAGEQNTAGATGNGGAAGSTGMGGEAGTAGEAGNIGTGGTPAPVGQQCGIILKSDQLHSGIVYAAPYGQGRLDWYRTDGDTPRFENSMPLSSGTIDMRVDRENNRLFVLHDGTREAVWYQLTRPTSPEEPLFSRPQEIGRFAFENMPVRMAVDRLRRRLFVLSQPPLTGDGEPVREMILDVIDVTVPNAPNRVSSRNVPSSSAIAIDAQRGVMFLYAHLDETLLVFDVTAASPRPLPEMTFDLEARFNEPSQTAFNLKSFRLDEDRGRLYAARDQVPNSQAVVFEYAPANAAVDGCIDLGPFTVRTDPLDQSVPAAERTNLMGAAIVEPILGKGGAFFVFAAWNGSMAQPMVTMLDDDLNFEATCGEFTTDADVDIDFGCFVTGSAFDDKGACVDAFNQVAAVTTAAGVSFFPFNENRTVSPEIITNEGAASTLVCY